MKKREIMAGSWLQEPTYQSHSVSRSFNGKIQIHGQVLLFCKYKNKACGNQNWNRNQNLEKSSQLNGFNGSHTPHFPSLMFDAAMQNASPHHLPKLPCCLHLHLTHTFLEVPFFPAMICITTFVVRCLHAHLNLPLRSMVQIPDCPSYLVNRSPRATPAIALTKSQWMPSLEVPTAGVFCNLGIEFNTLWC